MIVNFIIIPLLVFLIFLYFINTHDYCIEKFSQAKEYLSFYNLKTKEQKRFSDVSISFIKFFVKSLINKKSFLYVYNTDFMQKIVSLLLKNNVDLSSPRFKDYK